MVDPHEPAQVLRVQVMRLGHSEIMIRRVKATPMTQMTKENTADSDCVPSRRRRRGRACGEQICRDAALGEDVSSPG